MIDLQQLKILAQLLENVEIAAGMLEKAYNDNNAANFGEAKREILDIKAKISNMIKS